MASALAKVDISDSAHLKALLTETDNAQNFIKEFQTNNVIALESLAPALPLLDLHGVSRFEFHDSVFEQLKLMLERRIEDIAKKPKEESYQTLMKILDKAFPLASAPLLRPLVMRILTKIDNIPEEHLNALVEDSALYKSAPLEVRRHIWLSNSTLFCQEVCEEIRLFTAQVTTEMTDFKCPEPEFLRDPRQRRKNCPFLRKIVEMTRANSTLYNKAIESIKDEFKNAPLHSQPFIASLRSGLLMALHESEHQEMVSSDSVYKFAWCIDACIRAKSISELHQRELYEFLATVRASKSMFDTSMVLFDPSVQNLLLNEILNELKIIFQQMILPKSSSKLKFLLRLLKLGTMAPELAKKDVSCESEVDDVLVTQLLTSIVISLAKRDDIKVANEIRIQKKEPPQKIELAVSEFEALWKEIISNHGRFSGQLLRLQIKLFPEVSYPVILPLFGRNCRDMLSDQVFLHEAGHYVISSKNRSDEFLTPFLLKFLLSGKQAREIAAQAATKLVSQLDGTVSENLKAKIEEKIKAPKKKEKEKKDKDKTKDKKKEKKKNKIEKTKTKEKKSDKKLKIKLSLAAQTEQASTESE